MIAAKIQLIQIGQSTNQSVWFHHRQFIVSQQPKTGFELIFNPSLEFFINNWTYNSVVWIGISLGISVSLNPEQSTTVPSQVHPLGHATSDPHSPKALSLYTSSIPATQHIVNYAYSVMMTPSRKWAKIIPGVSLKDRCRRDSTTFRLYVVEFARTAAAASKLMENRFLHGRCFVFYTRKLIANANWTFLHLNFSSRRDSIFLLCIRFGLSHLAPDVSIGFLCKYSANHRKLQSQMNGLRAKCLKTSKRQE